MNIDNSMKAEKNLSAITGLSNFWKKEVGTNIYTTREIWDEERDKELYLSLRRWLGGNYQPEQVAKEIAARQKEERDYIIRQIWALASESDVPRSFRTKILDCLLKGDEKKVVQTAWKVCPEFLFRVAQNSYDFSNKGDNLWKKNYFIFVGNKDLGTIFRDDDRSDIIEGSLDAALTKGKPGQIGRQDDDCPSSSKCEEWCRTGIEQLKPKYRWYSEVNDREFLLPSITLKETEYAILTHETADAAGLKYDDALRRWGVELVTCVPDENGCSKKLISVRLSSLFDYEFNSLTNVVELYHDIAQFYGAKKFEGIAEMRSCFKGLADVKGNIGAFSTLEGEGKAETKNVERFKREWKCTGKRQEGDYKLSPSFGSTQYRLAEDFLHTLSPRDGNLPISWDDEIDLNRLNKVGLKLDFSAFWFCNAKAQLEYESLKDIKIKVHIEF